MTSDYVVGSIAALITGQQVESRQKLVKKKFEYKKKEETENDNSMTVNTDEIKTKQKKHTDFQNATNYENNDSFIPKKKSKKRKFQEENIPEQEHTNDITNEELVTKKKKKQKKHKLDQTATENDDIISNVPTKKSKVTEEENIPEVEQNDADGNKLAEQPVGEEKKKKPRKSRAERRIKQKEQEFNKELESQYSDRTLFVGNIPVGLKRSVLKKLFSKFGTVESVRIRGVPVADPRIPKKIAAITKQFHPDRNSAHSYVRFATKEDAIKALKLNKHLLENHHLRVRLCSDDIKPDNNKAIFVGNISFSAEEEDLWKLFSECGAIESVRLVRDKNTGIGKGFGYVNFESTDGVELALEMEPPVLNKRQLRISRCSNKKNKKARIEVNAEDAQSVKPKQGVKRSYQGIKFTEKKKKKKTNKGLLQKKKIIKQLTPKTL